jgi:four helix bundle protein
MSRKIESQMGKVGIANYDQWEHEIHERIVKEPVWQLWAYRKALFLHDLVWLDCDKLLADSRGRAIADQLVRSAGSISANIEEGYGRGTGGKEYLYYLRVALGSSRETKGWYWRGRRMLSPPVVDHRLALVDEIISLLITELNRRKRGRE